MESSHDGNSCFVSTISSTKSRTRLRFLSLKKDVAKPVPNVEWNEFFAFIFLCDTINKSYRDTYFTYSNGTYPNCPCGLFVQCGEHILQHQMEDQSLWHVSRVEYPNHEQLPTIKHIYKVNANRSHCGGKNFYRFQDLSKSCQHNESAFKCLSYITDHKPCLRVCMHITSNTFHNVQSLLNTPQLCN